jgi:hypothetical protein
MMRSAAICMLACWGLIAFSSCASKVESPEREARDEDQNEDAAETARAKAAMENHRAAKIEVVRLSAFPGGLGLEKKLQPQDQNQKVEICLARSRARSGAVSDSQRHALDEFVANEKEVFRAVRGAIYRHYRENVLLHREQLRSVLRKMAMINGIRPELMEKWEKDNLPEIKTGNEFDGRVGLLAIRVHCPVNGVSKIGLLYECSWDEEDLLGVRIAGSAVEEVGAAEVSDSD